jgi:predicted permease
MITAPPDAIRAYVRDLDSTLGATPGIEAVSQSWGAVPMGNEDDQVFWMDGEPKPTNENDMNWTLDYLVGPDYLKVMGVPLQRGRFFSVRDDEHAPRVAVVDEVFAQKYFGSEDPLGKRIIMNSVDLTNTGTKFEIVGVVGHVHQWGLDSDQTHSLRAQLYLPCLQMPDKYISTVPGGGGTFVMVRGDGNVPSLLDSLRRTSRQMNSEQVIYSPETMDHIIADTLAARRFSMILLGIFAGLALLLSTVGIYGVISYLVGQRTQEIGIRVALGARRADILGLVLNRGMKMALIGVGAGLLASLGLTQLIVDMLYGVSPVDPLTFWGVALVLTLVAFAACYVPARRAMRVDPMVALRYE